MKEAVAYCRTACAKERHPSAEVQLQEQMVRRYADARGHFAWPQRGKWIEAEMALGISSGGTTPETGNAIRDRGRMKNAARGSGLACAAQLRRRIQALRNK